MFKMKLTQRNIHIGEKRVSTTDVIAEYLACLKKEIEKEVKNKTGMKYEEFDIKLCLTMPAIWEVQDKLLMREAAFKAGLITSESDETLNIVLEPEAASVMLVITKKWKPGTIFIVVDCGGGTIDLTAFERVGDKENKITLEEVATGRGNHFGSLHINKQFWELCKKKIKFDGKSLSSAVKMNQSVLIDQWKTRNHNSTIRLVSELRKAFEKVNEDYIQEDNTTGIVGLKLSDEDIEFLYKDCIQDTKEKLHGMIEDVSKLGKHVDYVCMVGGFSNSIRMQNAIRDICKERKTTYIETPKPGSKIIEGAVWLGAFRDLIASRRSRATYGLEIMKIYNPEEHNDKTRIKALRNGKEYCTGIFYCLVEKNETLEVGAHKDYELKVAKPNQTHMLLNFYAHDHPDRPMYVNTDTKTKKVASIVVDMPDISDQMNRTVKLSVFLGGSEPRVEAIGEKNKKYAVYLKQSNTLKKTSKHIVFLIDRSYSMSDDDVVPTLSNIVSGNNNRLGAVYQAMSKFLQLYSDGLSSKKNLTNVLGGFQLPSRKMENHASVVLFNHDTEVVFENQPITDDVIEKLLEFKPSGGTNFRNALKKADEIISKYQDDFEKYIVFLTDGEDNIESAVDVVKNIRKDKHEVKVHMIGFSKDVKDDLKKISDAGNGLYLKAGSDLVEIEEAFEELHAVI